MKSFRILEINGDRDGFPDTNETADLVVRLRNPLAAAHRTQLVVSLNTDDPRIDCLTPESVTIPFIPAGAEVDLVFRLHVHPDASRSGSAVTCQSPGPSGTCTNFVLVNGGCLSDAACKRDETEDYSAPIQISVSSEEEPQTRTLRQQIVLDLDLNAMHPVGPTSEFVDDFEMSGFTFMNLDADKASHSASDGYRCQYTNPDDPNSDAYGLESCYLGFEGGQTPVNDWHVHTSSAPDGGRAYSGSKSLHYGKHTPGNPALDTYGFSQLDAARLLLPVRLPARVCRDDGSPSKRGCGQDADCAAVGGGPCIPATPELSIKHQVSLVDDRVSVNHDRAVVQAQIVPLGPWIKLEPFENLHNAQQEVGYGGACVFDPIDDGNDEDSYFDPSDPRRRLGPSSTCHPEFTFTNLGDTNGPFHAADTGEASDGPGLAGNLGPGTWVASRFDLSRFRGRMIRVRFLLTSVDIHDGETWRVQPPYEYVDDGWYVDDVRVNQTLGLTTPTANVDDADNEALLPGNQDRDARGDECDCAIGDPGAFASPASVKGLQLGPDKSTLSWASALPASGPDTVHDVARGALNQFPVGSGGAEACLVAGSSGAILTDHQVPGTGSGYWYLVRARNICGIGSFGLLSDGSERVTGICP